MCLHTFLSTEITNITVAVCNYSTVHVMYMYVCMPCIHVKWSGVFLSGFDDVE